MPDIAATPTLTDLLARSGLDAKTARIDDSMVRLQWGSAHVLVGVSGTAIVAIAPMFPRVPDGKEAEFYRRLLEHNAYMGGMAAFAVQPDGWVVLHSGRPLRGIDSTEFATMVAGVGRFADEFDDRLAAEFYGRPEATAAAAE